jgi:hypothetical protein
MLMFRVLPPASPPPSVLISGGCTVHIVAMVSSSYLSYLLVTHTLLLDRSHSNSLARMRARHTNRCPTTGTRYYTWKTASKGAVSCTAAEQ